jgi:hypothetical protein
VSGRNPMVRMSVAGGRHPRSHFGVLYQRATAIAATYFRGVCGDQSVEPKEYSLKLGSCDFNCLDTAIQPFHEHSGQDARDADGVTAVHGQVASD